MSAQYADKTDRYAHVVLYRGLFTHIHLNHHQIKKGI